MDMNQDTLEKMKELHLSGMYNAFKTSLDNFGGMKMTQDQFVNWLVTNEWDERVNRTVSRLIKRANFRYTASIEEINFSLDRGFDENDIQRLADLSFISEGKNIFITGSTGTGKSYISSALGFKACQKGYKVMYANTYRLLGALKEAKAKGDIIKELKKIERMDLLILDDFGMHAFDPGSRSLLIDIFEDRFDRRSTIIASQIPVSEWHSSIGDATIADAILDRIVYQAIRLELQGESLRKKKAGNQLK